MTIPAFMTQEFTIPAIADKMKNRSEYAGYSYKIGKYDLDDLTDVAEMQAVITRGMTSDEVVIIGRDKFAFMSQYFAIVEWMEKIPQ